MFVADLIKTKPTHKQKQQKNRKTKRHPTMPVAHIKKLGNRKTMAAHNIKQASNTLKVEKRK